MKELRTIKSRLGGSQEHRQRLQREEHDSGGPYALQGAKRMKTIK
jgi:hypothetical protein